MWQKIWRPSSKNSKCVHEGLKKYKCESCSKTFGQPQHLKRHKETVHERIKISNYRTRSSIFDPQYTKHFLILQKYSMYNKTTKVPNF